MLIIFKQDGWKDLLCPCSSATRRNNFVEKKIGEIVNLKKYLAVILVYLETPKTVPTSVSWEKYGYNEIYHENETISYTRRCQRMMLYKSLEFWKILN